MTNAEFAKDWAERINELARGERDCLRVRRYNEPLEKMLVLERMFQELGFHAKWNPDLEELYVTEKNLG